MALLVLAPGACNLRYAQDLQDELHIILARYAALSFPSLHGAHAGSTEFQSHALACTIFLRNEHGTRGLERETQSLLRRLVGLAKLLLELSNHVLVNLRSVR